MLRKSISLVPWRIRGVIKKIPLVAPFQRWLIGRFLDGRQFIHTVDSGPARGLNYPIKLPEDKGIWTGTYELALATQIAAALPRGKLCLDIGGWRGFFGGVMALAGASRVVIFEPLPENAAQIRRMIQLNPQLPLDLVEAAVSDKSGTIGFCVMPESSMGKLGGDSSQPEMQGGRQIQVSTLTLDEWFNGGTNSPPMVIKIDVEGAELLVLRGAWQVLTRYKPKLFIEIHSRQLARECNELLTSVGYSILVLETDREPDFCSEFEVCHFIAVPR
jgi:FkbM family methyltransferase